MVEMIIILMMRTSPARSEAVRVAWYFASFLG
jgi:hypothetical protein